MSYMRVVPRDLFNEANLLKCIGKLYLLTEHRTDVELSDPPPGQSFLIDMDLSSGDLLLTNVLLRIKGERYFMYRPLNSREPWPLYITVNGVDLSIFCGDGNLTGEFEALLN